MKRGWSWWAKGDCVADISPSWPVFEAMARAAGTAHVGLATPERRQGIRALGTGRPLSAPGFNLYPLADGRFVVCDLIKGASADMSGLRPGDVLRRIDGQRALRVDPFFIHTLPVAAEVRLEIDRDNHPATVRLRPIKADVSSVESRLLDDGSGYVHLRWFAKPDDPEHDTATLARRAFTSLARQGARGLILDLRSALGGSGEVSIISPLCEGDIV